VQLLSGHPQSAAVVQLVLQAMVLLLLLVLWQSLIKWWSKRRV
jgi:hypothetical protein